jgi:CRP/FNR family cyclic AMP-dependent transcriptional regulator
MANESWESFVKKYPLRLYRKGQMVLFQGESPHYAYVIQRGIVKAYNIDYDGKEQFIILEQAGNVFPKLWIWGKDTTTPFYFESLTDCYLYTIPRHSYTTFMKSDPVYMQIELDRALTDLKTSALRLNAALYTKASDKVAHILNYLVQTHASPIQGNMVTINIKLTHQDLASLSGLTRETVSVELNKLRTKGVVIYQPSKYRIDVRKLKDILGKEF